MKKWRVDLLVFNPATLKTRRIPCWEWDGEKVVELSPRGRPFRKAEWDGRIYTPEDGMEYLEVLHHAIVGTLVAATEPYEVEEGE